MNTEKDIVIFLFLLALSICPMQIYAQNSSQAMEPVLSSADRIALSQLPQLGLKDVLYKGGLPDAVNNANQIYFRPLFNQITVECGQYSGIAFNFCYEMNYSRKTPANIPENQYPTHYTFNFMNGGFGWHGVSYQHSFEIAKANGHPNVVDYGGLNQGGPSMWISGYDKYYHGMFNKIDEVYQIKVGTPEGLLVFKNWLHNHLTGDEVGGVASFYSPSPWNITTLPAGTPEGGKHVISLFSGSIGHACTITGYNDSIRYDYNQDGQYTNDVDINGDSIVDMKDWEIGGLLFTDSYNGGTSWADSGFCYMMYRTLAENGDNGGVWNHAVHVLTIKKDYEPLLAYKIKVSHNCRKALKVIAGISSEPNATSPDFTLDFPIFDYQGGCQYMQGGWDEDSLDLEFGLDVTPLLAHINENEPTRFFLLIDEDDPNGWVSGLIQEFSLMDYTNGGVEIAYPQSDIPLNNNGLTTISLSTSITYNSLEMVDTHLPVAITNEAYNYQLQAQGGTQAYIWHMARHYDLHDTMASFPAMAGDPVIMDDTIHASAAIALGFPFPFYGQTYDSIWIHSDGFILFNDQSYPWPYAHDEHLLLRKTRCIAPYLNFGLFLSTINSNSVRIENTADYAMIHWNTSALKPDNAAIEFALMLFPDGKIEFYYHSNDIFPEAYWASGISDGDEINYVVSDGQIKNSIPAESKYRFIPQAFPTELILSKEGLLSGTTSHNHEGEMIDFVVRDVNNLSIRKALSFYSYMAATHEINSMDDAQISLFPNPGRGEIQVQMKLNEKADVLFQMMDQNGKQVFSFAKYKLSAGTHHIIQNLNANGHMEPGVYFLHATINGRASQAIKFILLN